MTGREPGVDAELRLLAELLLERAQAWLDRPGAMGPAGSAGSAGSCEWCPVCAFADAVRGQPGDVGQRLLVRGSGLLAAWLAAVSEHGESEHGESEHDHARHADAERPDHPARVQSVVVRHRPPATTDPRVDPE